MVAAVHATIHIHIDMTFVIVRYVVGLVGKDRSVAAGTMACTGAFLGCILSLPLFDMSWIS